MEPDQICKDPDDPNRCQAMNAHGQCPYISEKNGRCMRHNAANKRHEEKKATLNYRLTKYQTRVSELATSETLKSLREEVGLLRMMIEEIVNSCKNENELNINSQRIASMLMQANTLVLSCHKLEVATGALLDKTAIVNLADQIINIISEFVKDDAVLKMISDKIVASIVAMQPTLE